MNSIEHIEIDGEPYAAVNTFLSEKAFAQTKGIEFLNTPGIVIGNSGVNVWKLEGVFYSERFSSMLLYGKDFDAPALIDLIGDEKEGYAALRSFINICASRCENASISPPAPGPAGIFALASGDFLLLPEELCKRSLMQSGKENFIKNYAFWVYPEYTGWKSLLFMSAVILYAILGKAAPYRRFQRHNAEYFASDEIIVADMRDGNFVPIEYLLRGVSAPIADRLRAILSYPIIDGKRSRTNPFKRKDDPGAAAPNIGDKNVSEAFKSLAEVLPRSYEQCFTPLEPEELARIQAAAKIEEKKSQRKFRRKRFFRKNAFSLKVAGAAILIAAMFIVMLVRDVSSKPSTKGMTALEVVEKFYQSVSDAEQEWPKACTDAGAGKYYEDLIVNIHVIATMRQYYEQEQSIYSPMEWANLPNPREKDVFGISRLRIEPFGEYYDYNGGGELFRVSFYLLVPQIPDSEKTRALENAQDLDDVYPLTVIRCRDTVTARFIKNRWKISAISMDEKTNIDANVDEYFALYQQGKENPAFEWAPSQNELDEGLLRLR